MKQPRPKRPHTPDARSARLRARIARARRQRGAALFIVVLVIVSLTGVAMFAARAASSDVELAGRYRQAEQTRYIADLGMQTAISQVSADPQAYLGAMSNTTILANSTAACENQVTGVYDYAVTHKFAPTGIETGGCYAFNQASTLKAIQGYNASIASILGAGTLASGLNTDFKVELTDKDSWDFPTSGYAANSGVNMKFYTVTLSGTGMIIPTTNGSSVNYKVSRQDLRAQLTVGPLPDGM